MRSWPFSLRTLFSSSNITRAMQLCEEMVCKILTDVPCTWPTQQLSEEVDANPKLYNITVYLSGGTP